MPERTSLAVRAITVQTQREHRQDERAPGREPTGREDVPGHGEQQDQHDPEPEHGHRLAEEGQRHRAAVNRRTATERGERAQREGHHQREDHGGDRQLDRRRQALEDQAQRRLVVGQRRAEVAVAEPGQKVQVLGREGLIEPHRVAQLDELRARRVRRQHERRRIAREMEQQEDHQRDAEQHEDGLNETADDVARHPRPPRSVRPPASGAPAVRRRRRPPGRNAPRILRRRIRETGCRAKTRPSTG